MHVTITITTIITITLPVSLGHRFMIAFLLPEAAPPQQITLPAVFKAVSPPRTDTTLSGGGVLTVVAVHL